MQQQARSGLPISKQLHDFFPDIEGQLCSRHSTLFCKLKTNFNRLYDNMDPQFYVLVKGDCQIVDESITEMRMSMGLENGIIILVSKTYAQSQLFINSNHFTEQLIFDHHGDLQQGLNNLSTDITSLIKNSIQGLKETELFGGIFYIHANIPEERFRYNQLLLMGIYLGMLIINGRAAKVAKQDVIQNMIELGSMGCERSIRRRFDHYFNRTFEITVPQAKQLNHNSSNNDIQRMKNGLFLPNIEPIRHYPLLNNDYKLMLCQLDLAKEDVCYEKARRNDIRQRKDQLMAEITKQFPSINNLISLSKANINLQKEVTFTSTYSRSQEAKTVQELQCQDQQEILRNPSKFLTTLQSEIKLVQGFLNKSNSIEQLIDNLWRINSKQLHLYTDDVVELVQKMKNQLQLSACMIVDHYFLMILVHKNRHTELLCEVKQKLNKGELKSKSLFKIQQEDIVQQRFHVDKAIGQRLFTSVPSKGVAIFDPSQAIWFQ